MADEPSSSTTSTLTVSVIINGHEIREYLAEGGFQLSYESRNEKSVTTVNGTIYKHSIQKRSISLSLLDNLLGSKYAEFETYLATNPATVSYSDYSTGASGSGTFYISKSGFTIQKSYGTDAKLSSVSYTLTEQ